MSIAAVVFALEGIVGVVLFDVAVDIASHVSRQVAKRCGSVARTL